MLDLWIRWMRAEPWLRPRCRHRRPTLPPLRPWKDWVFGRLSERSCGVRPILPCEVLPVFTRPGFMPLLFGMFEPERLWLEALLWEPFLLWLEVPLCETVP